MASSSKEDAVVDEASDADRVLTELLILDEAQVEPEKATALNLHNKQLADVDLLKSCCALKSLDLSFNVVTSLLCLRDLKNLRDLKLYNNKIKRLDGLQCLVNLRELSVSSNELTDLSGLGSLKSLRVLRAAFNKLASLQGAQLPSSLRVLDVASNALENLKGIEGLYSLEELVLDGNNLKSFRGLPIMSTLRELSATRNEIRSLQGLDKVSNQLDILRLDENCIANFKPFGTSFRRLTEVYLSRNKLVGLEGCSDKFACVEILDLSHNMISDVDEMARLASAEDLRDLKVTGNPFAMADAKHAASRVREMLPNLDCLDDRIVSGGGLAPAYPTAPPRPEEPHGRPKTPLGRPGASSRRPLGARGLSDAASLATARPHSARQGMGRPLLTVAQYEDETRRFEEQVKGYQSHMTSVLRELRTNLELPIDEAATAIRTSGLEPLSAALPEPPVVPTVRHKTTRELGEATNPSSPAHGEVGRARALGTEGGGENGGGRMELAARTNRSPPAATGSTRDPSASAAERPVRASRRSPIWREGESSSGEDSDGDGMGTAPLGQRRYDFLASAGFSDDEGAASVAEVSAGVRRDAMGTEKPKDKSKEVLYRSFRVPKRPTSARRGGATRQEADSDAKMNGRTNKAAPFTGTLKLGGSGSFRLKPKARR